MSGASSAARKCCDTLVTVQGARLRQGQWQGLRQGLRQALRQGLRQRTLLHPLSHGSTCGTKDAQCLGQHREDQCASPRATRGSLARPGWRGADSRGGICIICAFGGGGARPPGCCGRGRCPPPGCAPCGRGGCPCCWFGFILGGCGGVAESLDTGCCGCRLHTRAMSSRKGEVYIPARCGREALGLLLFYTGTLP